MTKQDKQTMNKTEELNEVVTNKLRDLYYAGLEPLELGYIDGIVDLIKQSNREAVRQYEIWRQKEAFKLVGVDVENLKDEDFYIDPIDDFFNSEKGTNNED